MYQRTLSKVLKCFAKIYRVGQVVNFSSLAQDCGISHTTVRRWLLILEASYLVFFLQPFYANFNKRLIKSPKLYFYDTGLACRLLGLESEDQLRTHYARGALFENLVILEIVKGRLNQGLPANLYFWRDRAGHEVDCLADWGGVVRAIEIKVGATFRSDFVTGVKRFCQLAPGSEGYVVYTGDQGGEFKGTTLLPFSRMGQLYS